MTTPRKVVLATRNQGKIRELAEPLRALGVELVGLDAFPEIGDIEEDGTSFAENALIKAISVAEATGLVALADDSGLEVDALDGRPGVWSARYADDLDVIEGESRDRRNMRKLLMEMKDVPEDRRTARFVCCMAAVAPGCLEPDDMLVVQGVWDGRILFEPVGDNGFGYDPVFLDLEKGTSAAELSREEKNSKSHRGAAVRQILESWPDWMASLNLEGRAQPHKI